MAAKRQVKKYFEALERLKARGQSISNDAVAREAGSGNGSIKRSRPGHAELIAAIDIATLEQQQAKLISDPLLQLRLQIDELQQRLDDALEREVCLLYEVLELREVNRQLQRGKVFLASDRTQTPS